MAKWTADLETTTDPKDCRAWAWGVCSIDDPDLFYYGNQLDGFMNWCSKQKNLSVYFHNLAFDGEFILIWLYENGYRLVTDRKDLTEKTFTTLISDKGQFYTMTICFKGSGRYKKCVTIYDSLKIIPFRVEEVAKAFDLPISKLKIDYDEYREPGHKLTPHEVDYLKHDVQIMAKALKVMFSQGLNQMTQGSNALHDFKARCGKMFDKWFPKPDYDYDVRQAYKGAWTYLNEKYADVDIGGGIVLDVNSLYSSVMRYKPLPYGEGKYFKGKYQPDTIYNQYVQMMTCQFELREGFLPTIQIKNNLSFQPTQYLKSSDGEDVTLCLTNIDLEIFFKHYRVFNITYHSGWKFKSTNGLFDEYVDHWVGVKNKSTVEHNKGMRTLAKLMLNALYGKFALNPNVRSKYPVYFEGQIHYKLGEPETRDPIYIPMGVFITSWARYVTITAAQSCYDRFIYADTDSLHLIGTELPDGLEIDPVKLGAWDHEGTFERARFLRSKCYIEEYNGELKITVAGLPESGYKDVTWDNFHPGVSYSGKLAKKRVKGGIVLHETPYHIKR